MHKKSSRFSKHKFACLEALSHVQYILPALPARQGGETIMANYGGFYKGDKKKQKKGKLEDLAKKASGSASFMGESTFKLPEILPKGKNKNE